MNFHTTPWRLKIAAALALSLATAGGLSLSLARAAAGKATPSIGAATNPANPEAGMSDAEREAVHQQGTSAFQQRLTSWVNSLNLQNLNLHALPHVSMTASAVAGQPSLADAAAKADLIVVGTVSLIHPRAMSGTETTFTVDQTLKGTSVPTVTFNQSGTLVPTPDWNGTTILDGPDGSLLLPGDSAVLLLRSDGAGGYLIQSISGWYQVVDGLIQANGLSPWGKALDGQTESAFIQLIQAALK